MNIELSDSEVVFLLKCVVNNYIETENDFDPKNIGDYGTAGFLIGKLDRVCKEDYSLGHASLDSLEEPYKNKKLFLGAGWHSSIHSHKLHQRLNCAISYLSGMQQNGGMGTEFIESEQIAGKQAIVNVIKDLICAFNLTLEDLK